MRLRGSENMKEIVKTDEIKLDNNFYPRFKQSWVTVQDYAESMRIGAKFPPIVLGKHWGKFYLIDGFHRLKAYEQNGVKYVETEILKIKNKQQIYIEAVKLNAIHGRPFSFQEKINIAVNLEKMKIAPETITKIIGIGRKKLKQFKVEKISYTPSGNEVILKKPLEHLAGLNLDEEQLNSQEKIIGGLGQAQIINSLIEMIDSETINLNHKIVKRRIKTLYRKLKKLFEVK